jgi:hypothetical protein
MTDGDRKERIGRTLDHRRQAKQTGHGAFILGGIIEAHLRQLLEIERGAEWSPGIIAGKHAVDIVIIERPMAVEGVQAKDVDGGDDERSFAQV